MQRLAFQIGEEAQNHRPAIGIAQQFLMTAMDAGQNPLHRHARIDLGDMQQGHGLQIGDFQRLGGIGDLQHMASARMANAEIGVALAGQLCRRAIEAEIVPRQRFGLGQGEDRRRCRELVATRVPARGRLVALLCWVGVAQDCAPNS